MLGALLLSPVDLAGSQNSQSWTQPSQYRRIHGDPVQNYRMATRFHASDLKLVLDFSFPKAKKIYLVQIYTKALPFVLFNIEGQKTTKWVAYLGKHV